MKITDEIILKEAIKQWGEKALCDMLIEESAELIQALSKYHRAKSVEDLQKRYENIAEEIADVEIMLHQMKLIFKNSEFIEKYKSEKMDRLYQRLQLKTETP